MTDFKYHIIDTHAFHEAEGTHLCNQIYEFWKSRWEEIYSSQHSAHTPHAEDFMRYHQVNGLFFEKQLAGISAHTFYDLQALPTSDLEYLKMFGESFIHKLKSRGFTKVVTFESLLVNTAFRKKIRSLHVGKLLALLGSLFFCKSSAEAMIATVRNDNKTSELGIQCGWEKVEANKNCRGFMCDLMIFSNRDLNFKDEESWILANQLWGNRIEHRGATHD